MFSKEELIKLLNDDSVNKDIFSEADKVRKEYVGDSVHLRALIEFSNICKNNCLYCGLQCKNKSIERYRLETEEILFLVQRAVDYGYKTIVLQSGEDSFYSSDFVCDIIQKIKNYDVALTLSIGERTYDEYKAFKDAGADRYLIRIETTDRELYKKMHPHMDFDKRVECLKNIKELGFETGTGCLIGLPGQTIESLANDILFFKEIGADMIGVGPFIPHMSTPLKDCKAGNFELALKVMALTRILLKDINIPATTAMETLYPKGRLIALQSGANVIMPNVTLQEYRQKYEIYPNKAGVFDDFANQKTLIEDSLKLIGRNIATTKGFRGR